MAGMAGMGEARHWRVVLLYRGKEEVFTLAARDEETARAAIANWQIDRPGHRLVSLTDVTDAR